MTTTAAEAAADRNESVPGRSDRRLLLFVLLDILVANAVFKLIAHFAFHTGVDEMRVRYRDFFHFQQFTDSWTPMLGLVNSFLAHPGMAIYQAKLYDTPIYPLMSVLPVANVLQSDIYFGALLLGLLLRARTVSEP